MTVVLSNLRKCGWKDCFCVTYFVDENNIKFCLCGHARFMHEVEVPVEVQVQTVIENAITQRLRENLIPREYVDIGQSEDFVSSDHSSNSVKCV